MKIAVSGKVEYFDTPDTSKYGKWRLVMTLNRNDVQAKDLAEAVKAAKTLRMRNGKTYEELVDMGADEYVFLEKTSKIVRVKASNSAPTIPVFGEIKKGETVKAELDVYPLYVSKENRAMILARLDGVSAGEEDPFEDD